MLIILPGWGGTKESWQEFIALAQTNFDVRCLELPGFGNEPLPTQAWGVEEYAAFVKNKINGLGIGKKVILAHSFGGQVATYLVGTNPGICDTLILSGAAIFRREPSSKQGILKAIASVGKSIFSLPGLSGLAGLARKVLYKSIGSPDYNHTSGLQREIFQKVITQDVSDQLKNITVKTLVVSGVKDTFVSVEDSRQAVKLLPNGTIVEFPEGKHGLHQSHTAELLKTIIEFLK